MRRWIGGLIAVTLAFAALASAAELPLRKITRHGVTLAVLPDEVGSESGTWEFVIALDSHLPGALERLPKSGVLVGPHGSQEAPIEWDGLELGPFHRHAVLRFAPIAPPPEIIEVRIAVQGEPEPRVFRWKLNLRHRRNGWSSWFDPDQRIARGAAHHSLVINSDFWSRA